jgi:soluble lytic murein transglycosylase-like protein
MAGLRDTALSIAQSIGIPQNIFLAMIGKESGWNPNLTGKAGEQGLGQLMPNISRQYGITNPFDPTQNLTGAAKYLRDLYNQYGSWPAALSAYNSGSATSSAGRAYASSVLRAAGISTASAPGTQPAGQNLPNGGAATSSSGGNSSSLQVGSWGYIGAIVLIIGLVIFGLWGVVKG